MLITPDMFGYIDREICHPMTWEEKAVLFPMAYGSSALVNADEIPACSGIYAFIGGSHYLRQLLYIGSTANLKIRIKNHHKREKLFSQESPYIVWICFDRFMGGSNWVDTQFTDYCGNPMAVTEWCLIMLYHPLWNSLKCIDDKFRSSVSKYREAQSRKLWNDGRDESCLLSPPKNTCPSRMTDFFPFKAAP